jgi:hypothetical protein
MRPSVIIVTMRSETVRLDIGRHKTLNYLKCGLADIGCETHWLALRVPTNRALACLLGMLRWFGSGLRGRVLPLQSMISLQGMLPEAPHSVAPIVYVDGVRLAEHGIALQAKTGGRLLIDFDDLLSRRVARMIRNREQVAFGSFSAAVPGVVQSLAKGWLRTTFLNWEKWLLRRAEIAAAKSADALGFTSPYEARLFRRFQLRYASNAHPHYLVLGPSSTFMQAINGDTRALRFVFIGADIFEQNRVAIQGIVELARNRALAIPAFIYGSMSRHYEAVNGVRFCGFVDSLDEVYQPGSILFLPRSVRGGIKSKILEAFEHGIPTIGSSSALEGFEGDYPWRVDDHALRALVGNTDALRDGYVNAFNAGMAICKSQFSSSRYWRTLSQYVNGGVRLD